MILGIDTSTTICSVALFEGLELLALEENHDRNSHSEVITLLIKKVFDSSGKDKSQLKGIILADGPGSYTGLRIGASAAKGLCYVLDLPLMSESNLVALAAASRQAHPKVRRHISAIDARRDDVYLCDVDSVGNIITRPKLVTIDKNFQNFLDSLEGDYILSGNGADKIVGLLSLNEDKNTKIYNSAANLRYNCHQHIDNQLFMDVMNFEPAYLQDPKITTPKKLFA